MSEETTPEHVEESSPHDEGFGNLPSGIIPEEIKPYLDSLDEPQRKAVEAIIFFQSISVKSHRGPLPSPETLKGYEEALPGCAERIVAIFEKQAEHRMAMERTVIPEDQRQSSKGQNFAFIIALSFLAVSALLVALGHGVEGTILGSVDLVALVSVFIFGKKSQKEPRVEE